MNQTTASEYTRTYTTYSGCDIVASFGDTVIGSIQGITYSVSREKAPVYTMGSAEPRSFSRGKRGIAGTLVFTVFDRDALLDAMKKQGAKINRIGNSTQGADTLTDAMTIDEWDQIMSGAISGTDVPANSITEEREPAYADEILPFDVTISFANEYGQKSVLVIYGVEILNEGTGFSIDSVTTEKACTFVARRVDSMKQVNDDGSVGDKA